MTTTPAPDERGTAHRAVVAAVKPHLRGWLHAGMVPLALAAGIVLIALAPTTPARIAAAVFSRHRLAAVRHLRGLPPRQLVAAGRRRAQADGPLQHLPHHRRHLHAVRPAAAPRPGQHHAAHRVDRRHRRRAVPRVLGRRPALALHARSTSRSAGWRCSTSARCCTFGGPAIVTLIAVGGLLYTAGALVYGIKRPNPSPRWFGFHEIFHTLTVAAFAVHYIAASMTVYSLGA